VIELEVDDLAGHEGLLRLEAQALVAELEGEQARDRSGDAAGDVEVGGVRRQGQGIHRAIEVDDDRRVRSDVRRVERRIDRQDVERLGGGVPGEEDDRGEDETE